MVLQNGAENSQLLSLNYPKSEGFETPKLPAEPLFMRGSELLQGRLDKNAIVAQRMKRAPSISLKLQRFDGMRIACMQDIGGLRAIVSTVANG